MKNLINFLRQSISAAIVTVVGSTLFVFSVSAQAAENCDHQLRGSQAVDELNINLNLISSDQNELERQLNKCNDPRVDLRKVKPGFKCLSTTGAIFTRVDEPLFGESWKSETGLIWSAPRGDGDHFRAISLCKKLGGRLPRSQEILSESKLGLHEVVSAMVPSRKQEVYRKFRTFDLIGGGANLDEHESIVLYIQRQEPLPSPPSLGRISAASVTPEIICVK